ncbi:MAG: hypothetical protein OEY33_04215 [Bdellovibrionales bacterium]|jgi:hypothetical protein|nr:hypothetical protein [Bdellovibrionales bacterium]
MSKEVYKSSVVEGGHYEPLRLGQGQLNTYAVEAIEILAGFFLFSVIFVLFKNRKVKGNK